jgi:hypothetical protein
MFHVGWIGFTSYCSTFLNLRFTAPDSRFIPEIDIASNTNSTIAALKWQIGV